MKNLLFILTVLVLGFGAVSAEALSPIAFPEGCFPGYNFSPMTGERCPIVPPSNYCSFAHLSVGNTGAEVIELQTKLVTDGYLVMPFGVTKGYFGNLTAQAVAFAKSAGLYNCNVVGGNLKLISPNGGEVWTIDQSAAVRWAIDPAVVSGLTSQSVLVISLVGPSGGYLTTINRADLASGLKNITVPKTVIDGDVVMPLVSGQYRLVMRLYDKMPCLGLCAPETPSAKILAEDSSDRTFTINKKEASASVKVVSPNGGERWVPKSVANIVWQDNLTYCPPEALCNLVALREVDINLFSQSANLDCRQAGGEICPQDISAMYNLDRNVSRSNSSYGWIVATDINDQQIPAGRYKVQVCVAGTTDCDFSDNYFEIIRDQAY